MLENKTIKYLGFGSPLIDMIADVSLDYIKKHDLKLNTTTHTKITETSFFNSINEEKEVVITYVPGGCSYNTLRVFNWINEPKECALLGSVGNDFYGELYSKLLEKEKILPLFEKFDEINTGICCVFCNDRDRGHLADLGASTLVSFDYFSRIRHLLNDVELIYTELFILKHRKEMVYLLAEIGLGDKKTFGFNFPSFYFLETYMKDIKELIEYADVVFSNLEEAKFFGDLIKLDYNNDVGLLCKQFAKLGKKNINKRRVMVITCGPEPAYVSEYDFIKDDYVYFGMFIPDNVDESLIVDTNGAGDAFAGGFLSQFVKAKPLDECMKAGHWAAAIIIQERGCQIPEDKKFNSLKLILK